MSSDLTHLDATQRWMHRTLIAPGTVAGVDETLLSSPNLSAAAGLGIYRRGYFLRIAACMREQFPALCHALGRALFDDFVADYIRSHPPQSHTLYDLGRRFAGFLEECRPDRDLPAPQREPWIDFMIDLARFEYQLFALFDAPGHEGKPFAQPGTPDRLLRLQPAFALGAYGFDVARYYHAVRQSEDAALPPAQPCHVALVRTDYITRTIALSAPHYLFLKTMVEGGGVEEAVVAVARYTGADADAVRAAWCARGRAEWIAQGFFVAAEA